ncbi:Flagellar basal body-associated protein FliL [Litoreibacter ascidiaceicola]|uniref:Flagellar protein FliL n=1 Tax=Litoreibacter ascidiaceicola TaxID=1486859 RepID=A0A1M5ARE2_9RHOB|nr:flagellar basal body-associated FliL family protein [Litoreibacter ascidiaceicola]SHF32828.1 Flagellar basal body-associated protein FliL [Litoreibacter ascidiaceicola]
MGALLPIVLVVLGVGLGAGAGYVLRPALIDEETAEVKHPENHVEEKVAVETPQSELSYVKINNQFVVPVIKQDRVSALVVLSLSLEILASETSAVYDREPKLRDAFLQVLFDHAYLGGFDGVYTASPAMDTLRRSLLASARKVAGENVFDVLITDIVRQDI